MAKGAQKGVLAGSKASQLAWLPTQRKATLGATRARNRQSTDIGEGPLISRYIDSSGTNCLPPPETLRARKLSSQRWLVAYYDVLHRTYKVPVIFPGCKCGTRETTKSNPRRRYIKKRKKNPRTELVPSVIHLPLEHHPLSN